MLKSKPNVDLISFFILRTQESVSLVPTAEMSLIPFPTVELFEQQLPSFDLIILQNLASLPNTIGPYLENIRSYVEGGGGLAMLGGAASFSSGGLRRHAGRGGAPGRSVRPGRPRPCARHPEVPAAADRRWARPTR